MSRSQPLGPRERLLRGVALRDSELLAIALRTGVAGRSAERLAHGLLTEFGSMGRLLSASAEALLSRHGLGVAKVASLKGVLAIAERVLSEGLGEGPVFSDAPAVQRYLRLRLGNLDREVFACLLLDTRHRLLRFEVLFQGTIDRASVHPRELIRRCLDTNAAAIILAHNHPSGSAEPSLADIALTERLQAVLREVGVHLLDHLVVGRGESVSMSARGLIQP